MLVLRRSRITPRETARSREITSAVGVSSRGALGFELPSSPMSGARPRSAAP